MNCSYCGNGDGVLAVTQAVILCGGFGTRLGELVKETPKPMLPVGGRPILEHTVDLLKRSGITSVILAAGYKGDVVAKFFGDLARWGIDVHVEIEPQPLGTAGPLHLIKDRLDDTFLMIYGDEFIDFDIGKLVETHEADPSTVATILARPSTHPWDSDLIQAEKNGTVTEFVFNKRKDPARKYKNLGNAGIYVLSKKVLDTIPQGVTADFAKEIFPKLLSAGEKVRIHLLESGGYVKDVGTPERFGQVENYLRHRADIAKARVERKQIKTVFLDRDGVLNREVDLLHRPDQLELLPGVPEAIKLLNDRGIRTVVVTNQPVIARGLCEPAALELIHSRLKRSIETAGGRIDAIYHCPHHPETQHGDGVVELRKGCECRKPAAGMLLKAKDDLRLDLGACVMIGDSSTDIEAGKNAGVRTVLVTTGAGRVDSRSAQPDYTFADLKEAARAIALGKLN